MIHDLELTQRRLHRLTTTAAGFTTGRARALARVRTSFVAVALLACPQLAAAGGLEAPPPTLPDDSAPGPDVQPSPAPQPSVGAPTSAPVMQGGPAAPAPRVESSLSLEGGAVWDGLRGQRVILTLANGAELRGTIVAHSAADLAISRADDGMVVSVPKAKVEGVRVRARGAMDTSGIPPAQRTLDDGRKAYVAGVAMLAFGAPLGLSGTVMLGICPSCALIHLPLLLPGIGLIIGGSIAVKRGKTKNTAFRKAWGIPMTGRMQLTPSLAFARGGGEVGFTLRF
ncbi:hypothetical protein ENSA5_56170 [Enhygromyxa salina]|uniref:Uncharacterized protein n=1 Tax=Enhygromyxa salina TaxID=215803 RepID=A0A2S9XFA1_9BACT|nr:hypothetical protein [Enhygromyxa salina]PRP91351.1 hypothetical protein ENSA5_56170 [Enhygromyxa salina]